MSIRSFLRFFGTGLLFVNVALAAGPDVALMSGTNDAFESARVEQLLIQAGFAPRHVSMQDSWDGLSLLVLVDPTVPQAAWGRELQFTQKLPTYYLRGGHVLVIGLQSAGSFPAKGDQEKWDVLTQYFWNVGLHDVDGVLEDSDHRALYLPSAANLGSVADCKATIERLLAVPDDLPAAVPAEDFGPYPSVQLRGDSLLIDGNPVLLKSVGDYDFVKQIPMREHAARLRAFHDAGFNSIAVAVHYDVDAADVRQFLNIAKQNSLWVQFLVQGPLDSDQPLRKEYVIKFLRFRKHPALIGWIFSDDMFDAYYPFISREAEIVVRYDDRQLPRTCTFMDPRNPSRVQDWSKWTKLFPFSLDYLYPLQKDPNTFGVNGDIQGGIKDVERLADNSRHIWGEVFSEQFLQAHMQGSNELVGLQPWTEHLLPTADQERLLTWRALLAGVKGMIFFYPESLEDQGMGRDRRNELAIAWRETGLVEDIVAGGNAPVHLKTSDAAVDASRIQSGEESVVVIAKDEPYYNRFVDQPTVEGLGVELGSLPAGAHVYQIDWPRVEELTTGASVTLHPFTLTSLLLITSNSRRIENMRLQVAREGAAAAREAIEVLDDERFKTEIVANYLPSDLCGSATLLQSATAALAHARQLLASGDANGAFREARIGTAQLEEYRAQAMNASAADANRIGAARSARTYLNIYFSLPVYAYVTRGAERPMPGQLRREILAAEGIPAWDYFNRVPY